MCVCVRGGGGVVHMDQGEFRGLFQEMSRFEDLHLVIESLKLTKVQNIPIYQQQMIMSLITQ